MKVVTWVEICVRSIDCRRANHEIKLVLSMFYFLESFWNPRLIPRQLKKKKVLEISIHSSRRKKFFKSQYTYILIGISTMHVLIPIVWSRIKDKKKSNLGLSIHPISRILRPTWWSTRLYRVCKKRVYDFWVACGKIVCGIGGSYRIKDDSTIELWSYLVDLFPWRFVVNL